MSGFHFLAGDEPYKLRFAERDDPAETWMVGRPVAVRAARLAVALRERVSRFNSG
jgi:CelD/BcsL family acetyltransferase involved in cellulose biosynthesis